MAESTIKAGLATAANDPKKMRVDNREAESHTLADMIAADMYLEKKKAGRSKSGGILFQTIVPPGAN